MREPLLLVLGGIEEEFIVADQTGQRDHPVLVLDQDHPR